MRSLRHWIGAALAAQPFYSEEIKLVQLMFQTWAPHFEPFRVNE
ncbi:hypothetical protein FHT98_5256 [Bosea sp. AK1]|nr:hypothetical protein [Bosea sp. AK1]TQI65367.1 hypothetical protein FHT98_5256 [Bosea sp. AK1]